MGSLSICIVIMLFHVYKIKSLVIDPIDIIFDAIKCPCNRSSDYDVSQTKVIYNNYESNSHATYLINEAAEKILERPDFNQNLCINIFITGFNNGTSQDDINCIFSQIKCKEAKTISIVIDHTFYTSDSSTRNIPELYKEVIKYVKPIGVAIGKFLDELFETFDADINIAGHSIGAHMLGYAGDELKSKDKAILVAFGIDPAGPCFDDCPEEHFKSGQATITQAFHCNSGQLGSSLRIADYNFVSGDGAHQSGCGLGPASNPFCSHVKCVPIALNPALREGIWVSKECDSFTNYEFGLCDKNDMTLSGYTIVPNSASGTYYFSPDDDLECNTRANIFLMGK